LGDERWSILILGYVMVKEKPARKGRDMAPRPIALTVRGRDEWKAWVRRLAAADRSSLNELVDRALARYAREIGFKESPPER
jgi:hypothetical protein